MCTLLPPSPCGKGHGAKHAREVWTHTWRHRTGRSAARSPPAPLCLRAPEGEQDSTTKHAMVSVRARREAARHHRTPNPLLRVRSARRSRTHARTHARPCPTHRNPAGNRGTGAGNASCPGTRRAARWWSSPAQSHGCCPGSTTPPRCGRGARARGEWRGESAARRQDTRRSDEPRPARPRPAARAVRRPNQRRQP